MVEAKVKVDVLIWDDHITVSELCASTVNGKPAVMATVIKLGCIKVCTRWVLKILTVKHQNSPRKHLCENVSSDEVCLHHLRPNDEDNQGNGISTQHFFFCWGYKPTMGFSPLNDFLLFHPFLTQFPPPSYSHRLDIFFNVFYASFPWSFSDSRTQWLPF